MNPLNIPPEGLVLQNESRPDPEDEHSKGNQQVYRLDLVESVTKEILRSLRNNEQVRLRCGKRPAVQYGKKSIPLASGVDTFPSELFTKSSEKSRPLYFSGRLSHSLELQKAEEDTAGSDEALAALESTLRSIQEQRASNETSIVDGKDTMRHARKKESKPSSLLGQNSALRKEHFLGGLARSTPSTPFLSASYSPRQGPTSAPSSSGLSSKDRIRLDAVRIPLVHLLAIKPMSPKAICAQLHCTRDDCDKLIDKVARECPRGDGLKELKEKTYRELDVFKFPYRSTEDRQAAIDHAIQAYDRMRVDKRDNLWQLLLPPEDRGKGKVLSKLNFDKRVPSKPERQGDDGNEITAEASDRDPVRSTAKKDTLGIQKKLKDKAGASRTSLKVESNRTPRPEKEPPQTQSKTTKQEGKFKSSERIEDSDEEANTVDVVAAKPKSPTVKTVSVVNRRSEHGQPGTTASSQTAKKASHKTSVSSSSSTSSSGGGGSGNEKLQPAALTSAKSLKPHPKPESTASRISPRPRHNSSPQKPSPLGSSPPTTSTDLDNSNSSKASNHSSAPSSPPSSTEMPRAQRGTGNKYSPVIADKDVKVPVGRSSDDSSVKRKAAPAEEERPAKRQQPNSAYLAPLVHGGPELLKQPSLTKADPERSSSPEKPGPNKQDVIEEARRFQKYYKRYKDLYDKISQTDEKERDNKDMGDLWRMHKRLKEMKAEIWNNWDRVEKVDKARELLAV